MKLIILGLVGIPVGGLGLAIVVNCYTRGTFLFEMPPIKLYLKKMKNIFKKKRKEEDYFVIEYDKENNIIRTRPNDGLTYI